MTGPERHARRLAQGNTNLSARRIAKLSGVRLDVARRIVREQDTRRAQVSSS